LEPVKVLFPFRVGTFLVEIVLFVISIFVPADNVFCFLFNAAYVAFEIGLLASDVLSTLPKPISLFVTVTFEDKA
jgi:hypothetical protein